MEPAIDFDESIAKQKLVYTGNFDRADSIITYLGLLSVIALAAVLLITKIAIMPVWLTVLTVLFITWIIANMALLNVLIKIDGLEINSNRSDIIQILNDSFRLNIAEEDQLIITDVKLSGFIHWGRVITVLLDGRSVYINIQTLGRGDTLSFFHGFANYLKGKKIAKRMNKIQFERNAQGIHH